MKKNLPARLVSQAKRVSVRSARTAKSSLINTRNKRLGKPDRFYASRRQFFHVLPVGGVGAELGVFKGKTAKDVLKIAQPKKYHLVDVWWEKFGEFYPAEWGEYTNYGKLRTREAYDSAVKAVAPYEGQTEFHVGDDVAYMKTLPAEYLDFVYIDSSHEYQHTVDELAEIARIIKPTGIIAGHDWHEEPDHIYFGVSQAVHEFCAQHGWELFLTDNHSQWAIRKK